VGRTAEGQVRGEGGLNGKKREPRGGEGKRGAFKTKRFPTPANRVRGDETKRRREKKVGQLGEAERAESGWPGFGWPNEKRGGRA